jgi:hypothetical protein
MLARARTRSLRNLKLAIPLGALLVVSLCAWPVVSCATVITPQAALSDPANDFVVDDGRTTRLTITASDGKELESCSRIVAARTREHDSRICFRRELASLRPTGLNGLA